MAKNKRGRKTPAYMKKKKNYLGPVMVFLVVALFCVVMGVQSKGLKEEKARLSTEIETLQTGIDRENLRTEKLKSDEIYSHTKAYAEEVAGEKLGYVHEGEIIFRLND